MTKREMVEAMMDGKVLECRNAIAFFDEKKHSPFRYKYANDEESFEAWNGPWYIKQEPQKRLMTRNEALGFVANTQGIVVRCSDGSNEWNVHTAFTYYSLDNCEWANITKEGIIGDPKRFEIGE